MSLIKTYSRLVFSLIFLFAFSNKNQSNCYFFGDDLLTGLIPQLAGLMPQLAGWLLKLPSIF